jgi:hypothetical protein
LLPLELNISPKTSSSEESEQASAVNLNLYRQLLPYAGKDATSDVDKDTPPECLLQLMRRPSLIDAKVRQPVVTVTRAEVRKHRSIINGIWASIGDVAYDATTAAQYADADTKQKLAMCAGKEITDEDLIADIQDRHICAVAGQIVEGVDEDLGDDEFMEDELDDLDDEDEDEDEDDEDDDDDYWHCQALMWRKLGYSPGCGGVLEQGKRSTRRI